MDSDLVCRSAVAFFDQFMARGAARDVRQLRDDLVSDDRTKQALLDQLPHGEVVDERQAFDAFTRFLATELKRRGAGDMDSGPGLVQLVSWTEYDWGDGATTSDPAQWHDWLDSVEAARSTS